MPLPARQQKAQFREQPKKQFAEDKCLLYRTLGDLHSNEDVVREAAIGEMFSIKLPPSC